MKKFKNLIPIFLLDIYRAIILLKLQYFDKALFYSKRQLKKIFQFKIRKNDIRTYKNLFSGKRCFIIATGPSLDFEDIRKLKNEYTFGMNSLIKIFPKLGWETTFYGIQDYEVFRLLKYDINNLKQSKILASNTLKSRFKLPKNSILYPLNLLNHSYNLKSPYSTNFSLNAYLEVFDGYTITYSLLQIAAYMGFKDIYLYGVDANYTKNEETRNFINIGKIDPTYYEAEFRMKYAYKFAYDFLQKKNINIYNATRGGKLEVFKRVSYDELFS